MSRWVRQFAASGVVALVLFSSAAHAAGVVDSLVGPYRDAGSNIAANILKYAQSMFWILAGIQFAGSAIRLGLQGADIQEWAAHLVRQIIFIGLYAWFMDNSYTFFMDIVDSFRRAATDSALEPQNIFSAGLKIADDISNMGHGSWNPFTGVFCAVSAIIIVIAFVWVAALVVVALCEMYILVAASVIMMGFGGSEWTRDLANKAIMLSVSSGAKLFIMELVISTGWKIIDQFADAAYTQNNDVFNALATVGIFVLIVMQLPSLASQFISGAASGSMAGEGIKQVTQAAAGAALAATGVGAAAGGAMASAAASSGLSGAASNLGGALKDAFSGGAGGGSGAGAAQMGGSGGSGGSSPARQVGAALGQVGRAVAKTAGAGARAGGSSLAHGLAKDMYGGLSGTGIKGGTLGGRIHAYMTDRAGTSTSQPNVPPPQPHHPEAGSIS